MTTSSSSAEYDPWPSWLSPRRKLPKHFKLAADRATQDIILGKHFIEAAWRSVDGLGAEYFHKLYLKKCERYQEKPDNITLSLENLKTFVDKDTGHIKFATAIAEKVLEVLEVEYKAYYKRRSEPPRPQKDFNPKEKLDNVIGSKIADHIFVRRVVGPYYNEDYYDSVGIYEVDRVVLRGLRILDLFERQGLNFRLSSMEDSTTMKKYKKIFRAIRYISKMRDDILEHYESIHFTTKEGEFPPTYKNADGKLMPRVPFFCDIYTDNWPYEPQDSMDDGHKEAVYRQSIQP